MSTSKYIEIFWVDWLFQKKGGCLYLSNQQSIDQSIENWLKTRPIWLREAASRLLKEKLTENDIGDLVNLCKEPNNGSTLSTQSELRKNTPLQSLYLNSISEISGIDNLQPRKPLSFAGAGITAVYGKNGSGKSGYVRILKKVSGKSELPLRPNVYSSEPPEKRSVKLVYTTNEKQTEKDWNPDGTPLTDLATIDIFDSEIGRAYITQEMTARYSPPQMSFFDNLVIASEKVREKLKIEQDRLISKMPQIPKEYVDTDIAKKLKVQIQKGLKDGIEAMLQWSDEDKKKLDELEKVLKTEDPQKKATEIRKHKNSADKLLQRIIQIWEAVGPKGYQKTIQLKGKMQETRKIAAEGAQRSLSSGVLPGIGTETWKALWEAARQYSLNEAYPATKFPNTGDESKCVLCHQDLDPDGKKRLLEFEGYITGHLENTAKQAESDFKAYIDSFPSFPSSEDLENWLLASDISDDNFLNNVSSFFEQYKNTVTALKVQDSDLAPTHLFRWGSNLQNFTDSSLEKEFQWIMVLQQHSAKLETEATKFEENAKNLNRTKAEQEKLELVAKKWFFEQKKAIELELDRHIELTKYEKWLKETDTTQISKKAGEISQKVITESFVERFITELQKLGAHRIKVELIKTRTNKGKPLHKILLSGTNNEPIGEILSEGQKRITELAGFLADVSSNEVPAPFIFDDPISSLDQDFEEKTIDRLIELSKSRQVIVFTHRLSFLGILIGKDKKATKICIREEPWGAGEPGDFLIAEKRPDKALNRLKNERVAIAKKILNHDGTVAYNEHAKSICSDFRILIERIVELELLSDVVQRHRREVHTKGKITNLSKINFEDCKLIDDLMTKYSCFEHSQSNECPSNIPLPDDIERDIDSLMSWLEEFTNRNVESREVVSFIN